jgi:uncharacterized membrane protein YedE/YeeE
MTSRIIGLGMAFGFVLTRAGATDAGAIHGMFKLTDLHLFGVIGVAIAVAALGFAYVRRTDARHPSGAPLAVKPKPMKPGIVVGGLMFGAGWAVTGTCPGTALAQLGQGTLAAGATVLGILAGAYLHGRRSARAEAAATVGRLGVSAG